MVMLRIVPVGRLRKATCKAAGDKREGAEHEKHRMHAVLLQSTPMAACSAQTCALKGLNLIQDLIAKNRSVDQSSKLKVRCLIHAIHPR